MEVLPWDRHGAVTAAALALAVLGAAAVLGGLIGLGRAPGGGSAGGSASAAGSAAVLDAAAALPYPRLAVYVDGRPVYKGADPPTANLLKILNLYIVGTKLPVTSSTGASIDPTQGFQGGLSVSFYAVAAPPVSQVYSAYNVQASALGSTGRPTFTVSSDGTWYYMTYTFTWVSTCNCSVESVALWWDTNLGNVLLAWSNLSLQLTDNDTVTIQYTIMIPENAVLGPFKCVFAQPKDFLESQPGYYTNIRTQADVAGIRAYIVATNQLAPISRAVKYLSRAFTVVTGYGFSSPASTTSQVGWKWPNGDYCVTASTVNLVEGKPYGIKVDFTLKGG